MNEAGLAVVVSMRDNASGPMRQFGKTVEQTRMSAMELKMAGMAVASVMMNLSQVLGRVDDPTAKAAARFLSISGNVIQTGVAMSLMIPRIAGLITWLKQLNVTLAITQALSGPKGWIALGGAVVAAGAVVAISRSGQGQPQAVSQTTIINNNIAGSVITEQELGELSRKQIIKTQGRSGTSGIK